MGLDYIAEINKECNIKYDVIDFRAQLKRCHDLADKRFMELGQDYVNEMYNETFIFSRNHSEKECEIRLLHMHCQQKNQIINMSKDPMYSLIYGYAHQPEKLIDKMILHYFFNSDEQCFDDEKLIETIAQIKFHQNIIYILRTAKLHSGSIEISAELTEFEYLEIELVKQQQNRIKDLEQGYFKDDDLLTNFSINLNEISMYFIYQFLKEKRLLEDNVNLIVFLRVFQTESDSRLTIRTKGKRFTHYDIGYLWRKLQTYLKTDTSRHCIDWINENFILITSHNKIKSIDIQYYKDYINEYKDEQDSISRNMGYVNDLFNNIKMSQNNS